MKKIDTMYHMSGRKENSKPTLLWNFVQKNAWHGHNYEETLDKPKLRNSLHDNWPIISKNDSWESQGKNEELFQNNWDNHVDPGCHSWPCIASHSWRTLLRQLANLRKSLWEKGIQKFFVLFLQLFSQLEIVSKLSIKVKKCCKSAILWLQWLNIPRVKLI